MRVLDSTLALSGEHRFRQETQVSESLIQGVAREGERWSEDTLGRGVAFHRNDTQIGQSFRLSQLQSMTPSQFSADSSPGGSWISNPLEAFRVEVAHLLSGPPEPLPDQELSAEEVDESISKNLLEELDHLLIKALFESITGKSFKVMDASEVDEVDGAPEQAEKLQELAAAAEQGPGADSGWGLHYQYSETYIEQERVEFNATGLVRTADGQEIEIEVSLTMERRFVQHTALDVRLGAAEIKDPLVINFSGNAAQLSARKFAFDIDVDGSSDAMPYLASNSGYLALDKNNDGEINNGSELFGPNSGDGFADLAVYDNDNNSWIDSADSIFPRLGVWLKSEQGEGQLIALAELGVGAIYLGRTDTPFDLNDSANQTLGKVRTTGIYLDEQGVAGTVQQLDLRV